MSQVTREMIMAARRELKKRAARVSLANFVTFTTPEYQMGWVHKEICQKLDKFLQDVVDKKSPRLIIAMPPRSGKSELVSRKFPAYLLGRYPELSYIGTSYSSDLSGTFAKDVKGIMLSGEFKEVFPDVVLPRPGDGSGKISQSDRFDIVGHKGNYYSVGVGGSLTGRGAECVAEGSTVLTPNGYVSIDRIKTGSPVMSYNETSQKIEVCFVEAVREKYVENEIVRIDSNRGRSLLVTPEHPVYSRGRYKAAHLFTTGEVLLCSLPEGIYSHGLRVEKVGKKGAKKSLLFPRVRSAIGIRKRTKQAPLYNMWSHYQARKQVLRKMLDRSKKVASGLGRTPVKNRKVRNLWERVPFEMEEQKDWVCTFLLSRMCKRGTQSRDDGSSKHSLQGRHGQKAIFRLRSSCAQSGSPISYGKRRRAMHPVWLNSEATRTPCRLRSNKQCCWQFGDSLPNLSRRGAQARGQEGVREEYVTNVEKIPLNGRSIKVYDLQVSKNHNFFANGVLVHNCLIVDDPISNMQEALSQRVRDSVWDWFTSTAYTRLSPGGGCIVMCTRWHLDDIVGRLIAASNDGSGETWEVIEYPAIAEHDEQYRKAGEALHPERFDEKAFERIRKSVGERVWASLYQQHPVPDGGAMFKSDWIQHWSPATLPKVFDAHVLSWDMTFKGTDNSDFVVGQVWAKSGANFYLLDQVRGRWDFVKSLEMFVKFADKWPQVRRKLVEDKANGPAIISTLKKHISGIVPITPKESKEARAFAVTTLFEAGNVFLPPVDMYPWVKSELLPELLSFPAAAHDDIVDSLTQALSDLSSHKSIKMHKSNLSYLGFM